MKPELWGSPLVQEKYQEEKACDKITIIIIIIIIIIILVITFTHGMYSYIPETNHVSTAHTVTAVLYLQSVPHVMLFRP